jgi:hypothetical protein
VLDVGEIDRQRVDLVLGGFEKLTQSSFDVSRAPSNANMFS